jgi:hypothetical protein
MAILTGSQPQPEKALLKPPQRRCRRKARTAMKAEETCITSPPAETFLRFRGIRYYLRLKKDLPE